MDGIEASKVPLYAAITPAGEPYRCELWSQDHPPPKWSEELEEWLQGPGVDDRGYLHDLTEEEAHRLGLDLPRGRVHCVTLSVEVAS